MGAEVGRNERQDNTATTGGTDAMSELAEQEPAETTIPAGVDPETGEVHEPEPVIDDDPEGDTAEPVEPDEEEAETAAAADREQELLAAQQEEEQSLEAQKRELDAKEKKLGQLAAHTAKRYGEILGPDLDGFVGCVMCAPWYPGIRLNIMPEPETVAAIKVAIGEDPDPPLHNDPYSRQCDSCGGFGVTKTNSHVQGQGSAQCLDCKGRGWLAVGPERDTNVVAFPGATPPVADPGVTGFPPAPLQADTPRTPAEEELRAMGAIVVWPPKPPAVQAG